MRRLLVLAVLGCASRSGPAPASSNAPAPTPDRVVLIDERGRVYRSNADAALSAEQVVPATVQQAVRALVGTYEGLGLTVSTVDWNTGQVGVSIPTAPRRIGGQPLSRYLDCGTTNVGQRRADSYGVTLNVRSTVRPESEGKVAITTLAQATARPQGVSGDPLNCPTLGVLEKRVNALAAERLAAAP